MPIPVRILAVALLSLTLGLHWGLLQVAAWGSMLVERSRTASLEEAIRTTFDGQHPCKLCLVVQEAKSGSNETPGMPRETTRKLDVFPAAARTTWVLRASDGIEPPRGVGKRDISRVEPLELPPPRTV
ncbi:MAG: hypothetical protein JNL97_12175 [Verrucomicrobiales bacterium]|nr:hypothetical protein [Verrucomicrobiales bacterium]